MTSNLSTSVVASGTSALTAAAGYLAVPDVHPVFPFSMPLDLGVPGPLKKFGRAGRFAAACMAIAVNVTLPGSTS